MALATTHKLTGNSGNWTCTRCNGNSGANNRGQADYFMGSCVSTAAYLETPRQARAHDAQESAKAEALAAMIPTPRQLGYLEALISKSPLVAQASGISMATARNWTKSEVSEAIDALR